MKGEEEWEEGRGRRMGRKEREGKVNLRMRSHRL